MKHHYIPQFYLRPWLGTDHKLEEFGHVPPSGQIRSRRRGTNSTGYEDNLYTLPGVTEETKQNVERLFMGLVDGNAAKVRDMMLEGVVPTDHDLRHVWSTFLLSLLLRHPEAVADFKMRVGKDWFSPYPEAQAKYQEIKRPDDPELVGEFLAHIDPTIAERNAIIILSRLMHSETTLEIFRRMKWVVIDTRKVSRRMMTSDRPLVTTNGVAAPNGHIGLPLGPTHVFVGSLFPGVIQKFLSLPVGKLVRLTNEAVIGQGRKYVYAVDDRNLAEVRRQMGRRDILPLVPPHKLDLRS